MSDKICRKCKLPISVLEIEENECYRYRGVEAPKLGNPIELQARVLIESHKKDKK